jgi:hypothetical protein
MMKKLNRKIYYSKNENFESNIKENNSHINNLDEKLENTVEILNEVSTEYEPFLHQHYTAEEISYLTLISGISENDLFSYSDNGFSLY